MATSSGSGNATAATLASHWWFTIDEFLDRAERVLSSEIARREDLATVGSTLKIVFSLEQGHGHQVIRERPSVADIESAAARVRPLFLNEDPVFHGKVTKAMGGLAQAAPQGQRDVIRRLKKAWQANETSTRWSMGAADIGSPEPCSRRTDRQIARDFVYGDLVHADPDARRRLRMISEDDRLLAAVVWVADATRLTLATKQLIADLSSDGSLASRPRSSASH